MTQLLRIYLEILFNVFDNLFLFRIAENSLQKKISAKNKAALLILSLCYSIPETIPFSTLLWNCFIILFIMKQFYPDIKKNVSRLF